MKQPLKAIGMALSVVMVLSLSTIAGAQDKDEDKDLVMVTGEHWTKASRDEKLAYLMGAGNVIEVEQALQRGRQVPDNESQVPVMVRGLKGLTLTGVMEALDRWYAANPDRRDRPVLETIYFEVAVPNSK